MQCFFADKNNIVMAFIYRNNVCVVKSGQAFSNIRVFE